MISTRSF